MYVPSSGFALAGRRTSKGVDCCIKSRFQADRRISQILKPLAGSQLRRHYPKAKVKKNLYSYIPQATLKLLETCIPVHLSWDARTYGKPKIVGTIVVFYVLFVAQTRTMRIKCHTALSVGHGLNTYVGVHALQAFRIPAPSKQHCKLAAQIPCTVQEEESTAW